MKSRGMGLNKEDNMAIDGAIELQIVKVTKFSVTFPPLLEAIL